MFDIIILNWNGSAWLPGCLNSLDSQTFRDFEITVVDNGSTDGSLELLSHQYPHVRAIALGKNTGFCRGNNLGAFSTHQDWVIILNNDTVCTPNFLEELANAVKHYPEFQLLSCKLLCLDSPSRIDNKGIQYSRILRAYQIESGARDLTWESPREVFGPSGAALVAKREVLEDIGLFDERFRIYHEDVDFAIRARLLGYCCLYVPGAVVYHKGHGSSRKIPRERIYYNQRNMELVVLKNIPTSLLWKYGFPRLLYALYMIARACFQGHGWTVLRAKIDGWRLGRKWRRESPPRIKNLGQFEKALGGVFADIKPLHEPSRSNAG